MLYYGLRALCFVLCAKTWNLAFGSGRRDEKEKKDNFSLDTVKRQGDAVLEEEAGIGREIE